MPLGGLLRCLSANHALINQHDPQDFWSVTSKEQTEVEQFCGTLFDAFRKDFIKCDEDGAAQEKVSECIKLKRNATKLFLEKGLHVLSESYMHLDASRPWLCYWILHSLELLEVKVSSELKSQIAQFLGKCQNESGGFGGGPMQASHLAPTYAAVNALCILGTEEAYKIINRRTLYDFVKRMHQFDGSFILHDGGEVDIRGCYLAASVCRLTHILSEELFDKTPQWIVSCQTYEGGFGGAPGLEAHGGYAFCGLAALTLLGHERLCDADALLRWAVNRQMAFEGGFQGRTNKLVDSCYSFWQGAIIPVLCLLPEFHSASSLFNNGALQEYILLCSQHEHGGFVDKPDKMRDFYHTCYALSGLSISQNFTGPANSPPCVIGEAANHVIPIHPVYNLGVQSVVNANRFFEKEPPVAVG